MVVFKVKFLKLYKRREKIWRKTYIWAKDLLNIYDHHSLWKTLFLKGCFNTPLEHTPKPLPKS